MNPFSVVEEFERAVAAYTGAPECVAVDSCTNAIFLALQWCKGDSAHQWWKGLEQGPNPWIALPRRTYIGVAQAVRNARFHIRWSNDPWHGMYKLVPTPVYDAAKRFTAGMYVPSTYTCVSFQAYKILPIGRGGAILTDSTEAAQWLRRARFDGRDPDNEDTGQGGWHMYMTPPEAARGLWLLSQLPKHNSDQPNEHVDISRYQVFR